MNREALLNSIQRKSAAGFLEEHVFDRVPSMFADDRALYVAWKRDLGQRIEVDPACLTIVGSAAVGFSLNPVNNFRPFDEKSDVDVAVISHYHFTVTWRYLRTNRDRQIRLDQRTRIAWDEHVKRFIYWGTIATDRLLGILPFGLSWLKAINHMSTVDPTKGRDVNLRIYADYESLRAYQIMSLKVTKNSLLE